MRPEVASLELDAAQLPPQMARYAGEVQSLLFDGANSAVLIVEQQSRFEFRVALPQTGRLADLKIGAQVFFGFDPQRAICFTAAAATAPIMSESASAQLWRRRMMLAVLLTPALLWLFALIILPHVELALLSFRERIAPRTYAASLTQYRTFFSEPLYWRVFVRTAIMSALATALTLLVAFPVAWIIAKVARGRASSLLFVVCLIPFWVSETVRALGWLILLRESGVLPTLLVRLGITAVPVELLYHNATILVGLVYTSLLFMVVPLVSSLREPRQLADRGGL